MIDYFLWTIIIIGTLDLLFTIYSNNDNSEKVIVIINNSDKFESQKFRTLSITESDENDYYLNNVEDISPIEFDLDEIKDCYYLLNEFNSCLSVVKNEINNECQQILNEKIYEFEKCDLIYSSLSLGNIQKEFDELIENEEDFRINEEIFELVKAYDKNEDQLEEIDNEEIKNKKEAMFEEIINESSILKNDKDCVEYELSENDNNLIRCVKYE